MSTLEDAYREHRAVLVRYIARRMGSAQNGEDIAQEAFLRLIESRRVEDVRQLDAYLRVVASHLLHDAAMRARREPVIYDGERAEKAMDSIASTNLGEVDVEIEWLLARLPAPKASMVILRKRDGHSFAEIASELGVSIHTVKRYLRLAMKQCRQKAGGCIP